MDSERHYGRDALLNSIAPQFPKPSTENAVAAGASSHFYGNAVLRQLEDQTKSHTDVQRTRIRCMSFFKIRHLIE